MKILFVSDARGVHEYLYRGLTALGNECELAVLYYEPLGRVEHARYFFPWRRSGRIGKVLRPYQIKWLSRFLPSYDVMSFVHRISLYGDLDRGLYSDIPKLAKKTKLMSYTALGCDEISLIKNNFALPYTPCASCEQYDPTGRHCVNVVRTLHSQGVTNLRKYFNVVVSPAVEYEHARALFGGPSKRIPFPIDLSEIPWEPAQHGRQKLNIVHSPSRQGFKGTSVVMNAIEILKQKRNDFEFNIVEGLPFGEYVRVMADADVVIDQVWSQSAGMNALWMLGMGKVVFSGNTTSCKSYFPFGKDNPVVDADPNPQKLATSLEFILDNRAEIPKLVEQGRHYIETYHDHIHVAKQYLELWKHLLEGSIASSH